MDTGGRQGRRFDPWPPSLYWCCKTKPRGGGEHLYFLRWPPPPGAAQWPLLPSALRLRGQPAPGGLAAASAPGAAKARRQPRAAQGQREGRESRGRDACARARPSGWGLSGWATSGTPGPSFVPTAEDTYLVRCWEGIPGPVTGAREARGPAPGWGAGGAGWVRAHLSCPPPAAGLRPHPRGHGDLAQHRSRHFVY